jgi:hypothetical protein
MATTGPNENKAPPDRSENLLPAEGADDGRFEVAEEVNLDQQSDGARRVGRASADPKPDIPLAPGGADDADE